MSDAYQWCQTERSTTPPGESVMADAPHTIDGHTLSDDERLIDAGDRTLRVTEPPRLIGIPGIVDLTSASTDR